VRYLQCIVREKELWQGELAQKGNQLAVLQEQLTRLGEALKKGEGLVSKWSKPMMLEKAVRFLKFDLDKEDIKDVSIVHDLGVTLSVSVLCWPRPESYSRQPVT
jgi:hypothetical protein